ncbi:hypothetical protein MA16_Dca023744 [Dendrobium catenatum]|uniref:Uncharacterized protein n=1 Tax=Dendrobium catenatum TaxID=906689 RepID=A0A2I0VK08_9ASPA|nr:hypothetical protein MA16_Dca023744 [Dendrobium catenatum]
MGPRGNSSGGLYMMTIMFLAPKELTPEILCEAPKKKPTGGRFSGNFEKLT